MENRSVRVPEEDIDIKLDIALKALRNGQQSDVTAAPETNFRFAHRSEPSSVSTKTTDLESILKKEDDQLLSPVAHGILHKARRALAVGMTVGDMAVESLGYVELGTRNREGRLTSQEEGKFRKLVKVRALVSLFAAAAHLSVKTGTRSGADVEALKDPNLATSFDAVAWFAGHLTKAVDGIAEGEIDEAVADVCEGVMRACEHESHKVMADFIADFSAVTYSVEKDDFRVSGFSRPSAVSKKASAIQFKKPTEVVGNHIAKSQAMRMAKMLASYSFEERKSPFVELGGFVFTFIGDGFPGTGKTTLIQMAAGLMNEYCQIAGYPFHFENFGVDQISEYQGKSGQNCRAFLNRVLDPTAIGFGTIDDVDQVAGKRDDKHSSSGQQEVTGVLMDAFAGANTVINGNCTFGMFSNYPEKVDDALRQRAGARWLVDGPQTSEDYVDILSILLGKRHDLPMGDHDFLSSQEIKKMVAKSYDGFNEPQEDRLKEVWGDFVRVNGEPKSLAAVGRYLHAIKEAQPTFTGRAIKNITDAVKFRSMDVDLPDEWFENPEVFMHLPLARKVEMIDELRKPITFATILQEINQYAGSEMRYADKSDDAAIDDMVRNMQRTEAANERFIGAKKKS
ncbi:ATP-binding protein [Roseibium sp. RKSG952]|uniref:ATP-binding protein n=1 Tax=Roseibium sp. RKSG952 TaxID=2529384 RepID=UPI0012BB5A06|nr:ATP-binding protein [Roseibium sp. RKSG952]MTH95901.1 AAA family ATPase [Roseibium sp. RKSG952]